MNIIIVCTTMARAKALKEWRGPSGLRVNLGDCKFTSVRNIVDGREDGMSGVVFIESSAIDLAFRQSWYTDLMKWAAGCMSDRLS